MMCRYLAYCPEEEPRIFRMLDLISRSAQGSWSSPFSFLLQLLRLVLPGILVSKVGFGSLFHLCA